MIRLNYYETEEITICPYCGDGPKGNDLGCCGESSAHFETVLSHNGETYQFDEVELYKPIKDVIHYEILNKRVWRIRLNRWRHKMRQFFCKLYDGTYPKKSLIRTVRELTGFQWSKLDCFVLRQVHQFPLYYTPPDEVIKMRQRAKEIENNSKVI